MLVMISMAKKDLNKDSDGDGLMYWYCLSHFYIILSDLRDHIDDKDDDNDGILDVDDEDDDGDGILDGEVKNSYNPSFSLTIWFDFCKLSQSPDLNH